MNLQTKLGTARRDLLTQAASCHADPENCDEGADVIVQAGLFGEIVYG